jgi:hypothetical protein
VRQASIYGDSVIFFFGQYANVCSCISLNFNREGRLAEVEFFI